MSSINPEKSLSFMDAVTKTDEFKEGQSMMSDPIERRSFLKLMAASTAAIGLSSCNIRKPVQHIKPYAKQPEYLPSEAHYFATSISRGKSVSGVLAKVQDGRPTKLEGNPGYYNGNGTSSAMDQADILNLYDPDRLKEISNSGSIKSLAQFKNWVEETALKNRGRDIAILSTHIPSPTFRSSIATFKSKYPNAKVYEYEAVNSDSQAEALELVYGASLQPSFELKDANVIVSFGSNFLHNDAESLKLAKSFSKKRSPESKTGMNRLYVFESSPTVTGTQADHRYALSESEIESVLFNVAQKLINKLPGFPGSASLLASIERLNEHSPEVLPEKVLSAVAADLYKNRGKSLVLASETGSVRSQALVAVLNQLLKNVGKTINYFPTRSISNYSNNESIKSLIKDIQSSSVKTVFVIGGNPVYQSPADQLLNVALEKVENVVHLSSIHNDTTDFADWVLPMSHSLESWGDLESINGTVSIIQPVIQPLYNSLSPIQLIQILNGSDQSDYDAVQDYQFRKNKTVNKDLAWTQWCQDGLISSSTSPQSKSAPIRVAALTSLIRKSKPNSKSSGVEISIFPDNLVYDGRYSNNPWLQECPDPITKLTWDNALLISPKFAKKMSFENGDVVELKIRDKHVRIAVLEVPGQAENSVSLSLGYGQKKSGLQGSNKGFSAFEILFSDQSTQILVDSIKPIGEKYVLAMTQESAGSVQHDRPLYREANLVDYQNDPKVIEHMGTEHPPLKSLWKEKKYDTGNQWGMTIDLSSCLGCQACVVACQSENNIPSVGKQGVVDGREMHWIRIDRYFEQTQEHETQVVHQPVACIQCENAPCEQVCPVNATVHDHEGLNVMVYNRCIGTRYCSNNCPIKVRRFNFLDWHQEDPHSVNKKREHLFDYVKEPAEAKKLQFNPQVTVRMRGMMEKCTYCTQRIEEGKAHAANQDRSPIDQEIRTACQQACPSEAIVFGNILDPNSQVSQKRKLKRRYAMLEELNIKPRTLFLGAIRNPNPVLVSSVKKEKSHAKHH